MGITPWGLLLQGYLRIFPIACLPYPHWHQRLPFSVLCLSFHSHSFELFFLLRGGDIEEPAWFHDRMVCVICFSLILLFSNTFLTLGFVSHNFYEAVVEWTWDTPRRNGVPLWFVWEEIEWLGERYSFTLKKIIKEWKKNADVIKEVQGKPKKYHVASVFEFHRGRKSVKSLLFRDMR